MEHFQRFLKIFGPIIGLILLYFVVRYAVLQFQGDAEHLNKVSPATLEEITQDPSILESLEEPMGEEAAEDAAADAAEDSAEGQAAADESAAEDAEEEAAADAEAAAEKLAEATLEETAAEDAEAAGDTAESEADEEASAAAVAEANSDEAAAASAEAQAEVDETAAEAQEEVADAGSEESAVAEDAEEIIAASEDELIVEGPDDGAKAPDEDATADASTTDDSDSATTPMGGPDSVLAQFHSEPIPAEYADLVSTVAADEDSITRGETTYTIFCTSCHGETGMGDGPAGQVLVPPAAPIAQTSHMMGDAYLFWRISEGGIEFGTAMTPWKGSLDEEARWDVINYVRSLSPESAEMGQGEKGQGQGGQGAGGNQAGEALSADDHYWVLQSLNDSQGEVIELAASDETIATFSDGSLSGTTACSNYAGKFETEGDDLSIEISATAPIADAPEGCGDAGEVDEQEESYLEALQSTATYSARQGQMEFMDEDGNVLVTFKAMPGK